MLQKMYKNVQIILLLAVIAIVTAKSVRFDSDTVSQIKTESKSKLIDLIFF